MKLYKIFIKNWSTLVTMVLAAVTTVYTFIAGTPDLSLVTKLLSLIGAMILFLALGQITQSGEDEKEIDLLEKIKDGNEQLLSSQGDIRLIKSPKMGASEYSLLWGGFTQKYFAYNPAYRIEQDDMRVLVQSDVRTALIEQVFMRRYMEDCSSLYLFFTRDGEANLEYFVALMRDLEKHCAKKKTPIPNLREKVKVRKLPGRRASDYPEIYFGHQHGKPTVIYEMREPRALHGNPTYYSAVHDLPFFNLCEREFAADWNDAGPDIGIWE